MSSVALSKSKHDVDMTKGNIMRHIIAFSLPLLAGNMFQQLYNMVDTWVVGNYVSDEAFAAVGTVGSYVNMLIGFFMGFSNGAGVVISQNYGAKKFDKVNKAVHTSIIMTLVLGIAFTILGIATIPFVLKNIMKFPADVYPEAKEYLVIYFAGLLGLMIYNVGSGIMRAVGDSKRPFYFLVVSAIVNIILDFLFVLAFDMGVAGVAYATIIAQAVSAFLVILSLAKSDDFVKLSIHNMQVDFGLLKRILSIGFPSAIQLAVTAFSNMFVYSYINFFGKDMMGGYTAYSKIDQIIMMPMQSVSIAITTFVGQNYGKGDMDRTKRGVKSAMIVSFVVTAVVTLFVVVFAPFLTEFFNKNPEVIKYGTMLLRYISPFFILCCANQVLAGALRGMGNTKAPMLITLFSFVLFRQIYLYIMANFISNTELPIVMSFPVGWIMCSVITAIYYKSYIKKIKPDEL